MGVQWVCFSVLRGWGYLKGLPERKFFLT